MTSEKAFYPLLARFLEQPPLSCFAGVAWCNANNGIVVPGYLNTDLIGIRRSITYPGELELVDVEVKKDEGTSPIEGSHGAFIKSLGQSRSHALVAHHCYLAAAFSVGQQGFDSLKVEMARRLFVGLIEIRGRTPNSDPPPTCRRVLNSRRFNPVLPVVQAALKRISKTELCDTCDGLRPYSYFAKRLQDGRVSVFWEQPTKSSQETTPFPRTCSCADYAQFLTSMKDSSFGSAKSS